MPCEKQYLLCVKYFTVVQFLVKLLLWSFYNDMNCNAIVIWWYENSSNALLPSMFEEKYVITLSFTLMEYIKNGNWIEFNNIMLDTLIFTRRMVVIFGYCIYNFSYGQDRHTSIIYFKTIMELKRQRKRRVTIFYMNLS